MSQTTTNKYPQVSNSWEKRNDNRGGTPRVNTYTSNTIRAQEQKRKTVFKNVLDSPFNISWPNVSIKDQSEILDALCEILSVMKEYKRPTNKGTYKKMKPSEAVKVENDDDEFASNKMDIDILMYRKQSTAPPPIRSHIYFGINEVTKHLERMISSRFNYQNLISANPNDQLSTLSDSSTSLTPQSRRQYHSPLGIVFVCKADLLPQLYSHFPTMCKIAGDVLLVPLPSGASKRISDMVNFKRVSCIGVKTNAPEFTRIYRVVREKVKPVDASWLNPLKPPENLLNKRKITKEEEVVYLKQGRKKEEFTYSLPSSNTFKRKQVEMTCDDEPKIKVEVSSSSCITSSPSIFFFGEQPQIKIEPASTQSKLIGFDYVPTQFKQLITTVPVNKDQAKEKRREKKLKHKQRKMNIKRENSTNESILDQK